MEIVFRDFLRSWPLKIHSLAIIMAFDWLNVTGIPAKGDPATANQDLTPMLHALHQHLRFMLILINGRSALKKQLRLL